ncbi:HAMP domain-containing protein [bacterium]|nr:HAMP domain-containing protein [bacterium]
MGSLRTRLVLTSLLVALIAVVATAFVVNRETVRQADAAVERDAVTEQIIYEQLSFHALTNQSWDDVESVVSELSDLYGERIALTTLDGEPIADSADRDAGLPDAPAGIIDPGSPVIEFDPQSLAAQPDAFLTVVEQINAEGEALAGFLGDIGVPFSVSGPGDFGIVYPAWDPADPEAAGAVKQFFLEQVLTGVGENLDPDLVALEELSTFILESGLPIILGDGTEGGVVLEGIDSDSFGMIEEFLFGGGRGVEVLGPVFSGETAEPALLFLGLPGGDTTPTTPVGWRLLLAVALVAAIAVAVTVLVSRRMLQPIGRLTTAAKRLESGDLTERVEAGGSDEIGHLAGAFNSMAASLESQDALRRRVTGDIAHELRTPLSNIRGYLEAILEGVAQPEPVVIESLHEEAVHLQRLVDDLQDLALAESGELRIDLVDLDLGDLVTAAVAAHRVRAGVAGVDLSGSTDGGLIVFADADRLRQILANLIENAVRHTPDGGSVTVTARDRGGVALIEVADTGEGIDPDDLPHVFERLYRADASRSRETGGSGLGLAIVRELVRMHGGTVTAASIPDQGTTISVELPASSPD